MRDERKGAEGNLGAEGVGYFPVVMALAGSVEGCGSFRSEG
jgi:hypothetical protein